MPQGFANFKDLPTTPAAPPQQGGFASFQDVGGPAPAASRQDHAGIGSVIADTVIGIGKGAANTTIGLGQLVNQYVPGVARINEVIHGQPVNADTFAGAREAFATPTNTAQRVGFGAEQIGEFFAPVGAAGRVARAAEVGKSGLLTLAQGGSPLSAGISAGITAAIPGARGVQRLSEGLEQGAQKEMAQALGATKEPMKVEAARLAPEMFDRGVKGSRQTMLEQAHAKVAALGPKIGAEVDDLAAQGQTVSGDTIRQAISDARKTLTVPNANGTHVPIEGAQAVVAKLDKLDQFVTDLGPDIPVDKAQKVKQAWDRIVSKSGLYNQRAGASATDNANAWAIREGTTAFRELLANSSPTLADLNKEFAFWKGLRTVLSETQRRTQAQAGSGLVAAGTGGAGAIVGGMTGDSTSDRVQNAVLGGLAGRQLIKAIQSPAWRTTVSGPLKHKLAEALASGNGERVTSAVGRIVASVPSLRESLAR